MKKILNADVSNVVEEMLSGYLQAYEKYYRRIGNYNAFKYTGHRKGKVALVIGGGSGHEPLFSGFCGMGLADAVACGNICASPNPGLIKEAAKAVNQGRGVLFVYGCYAGDNLNFDMAEKLCHEEGIKTEHVRVWDDCASAPRERITDRRGIAGDIFVIKIAGAACDAGLDLKEVVRITEKARDNINTIGLAISPGTLPGNAFPTFELADDEVEFGMGLHGEPGIERTKMQPANELVGRMYTQLKQEMGFKEKQEVAVLVNGLGSTPLLELYVVYNELHKLLKADDLTVLDAEVKTYCTCMEMGGFSITILKLDEELKQLLEAPCYSPYYARGAIEGCKFSEFTEEDSIAKEAQLAGRMEESARACKMHELEEVKIRAAQNTVTLPVFESRDTTLTELRAKDVRDMLLYIADRVIEQKLYLTEIDSAIGDGDHGIGMAGGMEMVKKRLAAMGDEENVYALFEEAGNAMLMSMGGASGVVFGSLYMAGAKGRKPKNVMGPDDLASMERRSLLAIKELGKAKPGDKTMVDALEPAVEAMEANCGRSLVEMLKAAEDAARQGMENTKQYAARFGRAKSLMDRSIGHQDAGATSVWLIFQGMRKFVEADF